MRSFVTTCQRRPFRPVAIALLIASAVLTGCTTSTSPAAQTTVVSSTGGGPSTGATATATTIPGGTTTLRPVPTHLPVTSPGVRSSDTGVTAATSITSTVDPAREAAEDKASVLGPLAFRSLASAVPVIASDGRRHFAYELTVVNQSTGTARIDSIQAQTPNRVDVGDQLGGDALKAMFRINGSDATDATLRPGGSGTVFLDVVTAAGAPVPTELQHSIVLTFTPAATGKSAGKATALRLTGVPVTVDQRAPVVVAAPLRGKNWVVGNGCCSPINAHRGSTLSINGTVSVAQRFAVDMVQLTDTGEAITGNAADVTSYPAFGNTVYAAAAGTVVGRHDGEKEQTPGKLPADATVQNADGNFLVIDIGDGRYAFYAHMQPGSIKPKIGDKVNVGDKLGLLGNTGNTDAPHLHFHIMDGPSPLRSNGLPFVFDTFTVQGALTDINELDPATTKKVSVDTATRTGTHTNQMPLGADLLTFDN